MEIDVMPSVATVTCHSWQGELCRNKERTRKNRKIQAKQVNVSFNSTYPQLQIDTADKEPTYANFTPNSSFAKSWT
ncbi:hypothetical protein GDO78_012660 [Eleutherodactylus coqui]|uniref:Uncharacterized protein n=1 Tax=Eleutherodactylus coqui TaxID=57060 RepID=A0A8J6F2T8_ELECQ|nr:hypothetical protein GDO78_012660 [Eleutherodactylus coqui]